MLFYYRFEMAVYAAKSRSKSKIYGPDRNLNCKILNGGDAFATLIKRIRNAKVL